MVDRKNNEVERRNNGSIARNNEYATRSFRDLTKFMRNFMSPVAFMDPFSPFNDAIDEIQYSDPRAARVYKMDDGYDVNVDLPGVSKDDVKITMPNDEHLRIEVSKHEEDDNHTSYNHHVEEVYVGKANVDGITARFDKGVLMIHVPTKEGGKDQKTITID